MTISRIGAGNPNWKGGIYSDWEGRIYVYAPNHPFPSRDKHVRRSHLVMEKYLGRYLSKGEHVHHINEDKSDDRIENLSVVSPQEHCRIHLAHRIRVRKICSVLGCGKPHEARGYCNAHYLMFKKHNDPMIKGNSIGVNNGMAKLTDKLVLEIRKMATSGQSNSSIARYFSVSRATIFRVVNKINWTSIT